MLDQMSNPSVGPVIWGRLQKALSIHFPAENIISSLPGPAAYVLSEADWQQSKMRLTEGNHIRKVQVSAPGKLFLAGEYAVEAGNPAMIAY